MLIGVFGAASKTYYTYYFSYSAGKKVIVKKKCI
jgi:hypothetical protein